MKGSGYSPTRFAFRAHEMRILRRSMERPLPKRKGDSDGKTEKRKRDTEAFQTDRRNGKTVSRAFQGRKNERIGIYPLPAPEPVRKSKE